LFYSGSIHGSVTVLHGKNIFASMTSQMQMKILDESLYTFSECMKSRVPSPSAMEKLIGWFNRRTSLFLEDV